MLPLEVTIELLQWATQVRFRHGVFRSSVTIPAAASRFPVHIWEKEDEDSDDSHDGFTILLTSRTHNTRIATDQCLCCRSTSRTFDFMKDITRRMLRYYLTVSVICSCGQFHGTIRQFVHVQR